jgi:hypothetical protein
MDYHFVFATGGAIPPGASPHGNEATGEPLWVARSPGITDPFFFHGGIHPGKVRPGFGAAFIPFGGNEESVPDYACFLFDKPVMRRDSTSAQKLGPGVWPFIASSLGIQRRRRDIKIA